MVFVLDIGTRSIIGLVGTLQKDKIIVHHTAIEFHEKRVMYDGQIHDIEGVAEIVKKVKKELEEKLSFPLKKVSIAAAGRALKTFQTVIEKDLDEYKEINSHFVDSMEIEGIQKAQRGLEEISQNETNYFCVGHTVLGYYLNDGFITNPVGHHGKRLKIDVLATFLPKIVINSLYTVMEKVGLEVNYLTLEPIAAIEVAVPENMRLLNIALVDIGAGTSDIAITKDGGVVAYGMTSTAGDEITEELAKRYLLDFDSGEKLKCNLNKEEKQSFTDIVGIPHEVDTEEILDNIQPAIEVVAKGIADNILLQNGKATSVVFLIGGGSQIPRLNHLIADYLQLPRERVVVRGMELIQNLQWDTNIIKGPEGITPIGILTKALRNNSGDFIEVNVGNEKVRLLKTKKLKVRDVLLAINFNPRDLIPKKGTNINILLNGKEKSFYGEYGEAAKILLENMEVSVDTSIKDGDNIYIQPATKGKDAVVLLGDVVDFQDTFFANEKELFRFYDVRVNGKEVIKNYLLQEGDEIVYKTLSNIEDLCNFLNISFQEHDIYVDGKKVSLYANLEGVEQVVIDKKKNKPLKKGEGFYEKNGIEILYNGEGLTIHGAKKELIFVDIFNYIDFDRTAVKGKLVLKHNGEDANYTAPLQDGDEVWVYWD